MNKFDNPFYDLWLTEILSPQAFVEMFSPKIVDYTESIAGTGNVIVRGTPGSGKSMLLRLLDTKTRIAYAKHAIDFPIRTRHDFISGSINLARSNIKAISGRLTENPTDEEIRSAAAIFSDFLNYSLTCSLLKSIVSLADQQLGDNTLRDILYIDMSKTREKNFVHELSVNDAWFGGFRNCASVRDIITSCERRISQYLSYFNFQH